MRAHRDPALAAAFVLVTSWAASTARAAPNCPPFSPRVFVFDDISPDELVSHDEAMHTISRELKVPNTVVVLGPNVHIDFSRAADDEVPIELASCTALVSQASIAGQSGNNDGVAPQAPIPSARSPHSVGPLLEYGPSRGEGENAFLLVSSKYENRDTVRISGFRLYGPSFDQQDTGEAGIRIVGSLDVEVSNMEIAGWGGDGVAISDLDDKPRIDEPSDVRIVNNYIHHNQNPRGLPDWLLKLLGPAFAEAFADHGTAGYGVMVGGGAFAEISANVFDSNRHAIAATGDMGGYDAIGNLVLKGGGVHFDGWFTTVHTHQFDIHGTGDNGFGGRAGGTTLFAYNSFQYSNNEAIGIRGQPEDIAVIRDNVFVQDDVTGDAIDLNSGATNVDIQTNNRGGYDSYGKYAVCDFDGDEVDDLFLATGQTWWFSSFGEFQWTYLATRIETQEQLRFGYFDADDRCDVLTQSSNGEWVISSGGVDWWQSIGNYQQVLDKTVAFGRFDPDQIDHRAGANKRTTHAFRKLGANNWQVTALHTPETATDPVTWTHTQTSGFAPERLRFGDFTGDGVTDVLAVQGGGFSISESARSPWRKINSLTDDVSRLYIVDLDHDNIDDLVRLRYVPLVGGRERVIFDASYGARTAWQELTRFDIAGRTAEAGAPLAAQAGRFGLAPGGGVLLVDHARRGRFYSDAETRAGRDPSWQALYPY